MLSDSEGASGHSEEEARRAWLAREFERCRPWMEAALDHSLGEHAIEDIRIKLESGWAQLWALPNGCMVTEVETYPTGKRFLRGWLCGGDLAEVKSVEPKIAAWAKAADCERVVITGRAGWLRAFPGYREAYRTMTKEL